MPVPALSELLARDPLVVVGIDPGTRSMGYGVVGRRRGAMMRVDHGAFRPPADADVGARLCFLFERLRALFAHHAPDVISLEQTFFGKNPQSTLRIGEARAVVILAAGERSVPVVQYPTKTAKRSVTGAGSADKALVQQMVAADLGLPSLPEPHDAADALALALCALRDPALDPRFALR
ncbi:MAG TPA: crossover junction endodeoxyribonuclease RuvC [Planctomycetota bacterium]|nr:crossover junction endodeoxyribonuclease RuvC [Planctomycetota bacterium]